MVAETPRETGERSLPTSRVGDSAESGSQSHLGSYSDQSRPRIPVASPTALKSQKFLTF